MSSISQTSTSTTGTTDTSKNEVVSTKSTAVKRIHRSTRFPPPPPPGGGMIPPDFLYCGECTTDTTSTSNTEATISTQSAAVKRIHRSTPFPPPPPPPPGGGMFHPDFMYCGECSDCNTAPATATATAKAKATSATTATRTRDSSQYLHHQESTESDNTIRLRLETILSVQIPQQQQSTQTTTTTRLLVESLLQPIAGVHDVNLPDENSQDTVESAPDTLEVCVEHDATCHIPDLIRVLQQGGYPASVVEQESDQERNDWMGQTSRDESYSSATSTTSRPKPVRSSFAVQGICCASEVPSIRKIVRPLLGVASLQINIATKRVYVQHDPSLISAQGIGRALTQQGFPATILENGGTKAAAEKKHLDDIHSSVGRTTLHTEKVLHAQDVADIQKQLVDLDGVKRIGVNVAECVVYVEHDVKLISAATVCERLGQGGYASILVQDAHALLAQTEQTNAILSQPRSKYVESTLYVSNLTQKHLSILAKATSQQYIRAQVRAVHPHVTSRTVKVEHNPNLVSIEAVAQMLGQYGLDVSVVTDGQEAQLILPLLEQEKEDQDEFGNPTQQSKTILGDWLPTSLSLHVWLSGIFWIICLLSVVEGWDRLEYAGLFSVLFGLPPVALKAWRTLRRCEFDANCMMVTAAVGALALGELDEAASVAFLFAISEFLEARATDKARTALAAIVQLRPEHANVIHPESKEIVVIPADRVPVGSLISVRTGDKVAADGIVVEGTSQLDESSLTGESVPVPKKMNDFVSGGGINVGATQLIVRTTTSVEDSAVSRLIRLVEEAQANRSPTEKMIDGFSRAYTPAVLFIAVIMCTVPWFWGNEVGRQWMLNGLIIVVIACPCALTISTPVTYAAGLAATAQRGIIVKGGASLEALGGVATVLFDKTGTLTEGKFKILHLEEIGETRTRKEMLELLALMEAPSSHPVSATLVQAARHEGVVSSSTMEVREHSTLKGEGVTALVQGKRVFVGNVRLFDRVGMYGSLPQTYHGLVREWNQNGASVGFIGVEGEGIIGTFCVTDVVRPEAKDVVECLIADGIDVQMLTGDGEGAAHSVASQICLAGDRVHAKLLPEDKLHYVGSVRAPALKHSFKLFRRAPQVLFCGDGVNDAPALAVADVGVSMGEGASLAMEMSDVTLMDSNLHKLLYVIKMGSRVVFTIQENILLSLACKIVVVLLTFLGHMTLMFAIASDVGVMLVVTLNGMKLLPGDPEGGLFARLRRANRRAYQEVSVRNTEMASSPDSTAETGEQNRLV